MIRWFNNLSLWIRLPLFLALAGGPSGFWFYKTGAALQKQVKSKKRTLSQTKKSASKLQPALMATATPIYKSQLVREEDFYDILESVLPEVPKKKLGTLNTGQKIDLSGYIKSPAGPDLKPDPSLQSAMSIKGLSNPMLMARETHFDVVDSFLNIYEMLKRTDIHKNVFWREISIMVKDPPTSHAKIKFFTISSEG